AHNRAGIPKTYMLYGHVHNSFDEYLVNSYIDSVKGYKRTLAGSDDMKIIPCNMINCFCMYSDYVPLTLDEWIEVDRKRRQKIKLTDYECDYEGTGIDDTFE
ncbi:MAG: hypothetical protein K6F84_03825, partial [Lachnospiraceae bacterium]|nr:hypothetical protein [Lachnospiraceae bacterium]